MDNTKVVGFCDIAGGEVIVEMSSSGNVVGVMCDKYSDGMCSFTNSKCRMKVLLEPRTYNDGRRLIME